MLEQEPKILSDTMKAEQAVVTHERYLEGWHPERGILTMGWSGQETIETVQGVKPNIVVTVYDRKGIRDLVIRELWMSDWGYEIKHSLDLANSGSDFSEVHKGRLKVFYESLPDRLKQK